MGWFNRKPRDLIADSNAEWEEQRDEENRLHRNVNGVIHVPAEMGLTAQEFQDQMLIAAGGWCAPSAPSFIDLSEIQVKRGGTR